MNREQALAEAKEGESLHADLPYTSFTSAEEQSFINGLFHPATFDLVWLPSTAALSIPSRGADKGGDSVFHLW